MARSRELLERAIEILAGGGMVAYPTDTLYGLAVDPRQGAAVERLFEVKGRPAEMAVPLIASDLDQAEAVGMLGERERRVAHAFWPGPLSIVVPAKGGVQPRVLGGGGTVAIRVPAHPLARALAAGLGFCITSTSANRSGAPATADPVVVAQQLGAQLDLIVDEGPSAGGPPSTIVAFDREGVRLVRAGAIAFERVLESLQ